MKRVPGFHRRDGHGRPVGQTDGKARTNITYGILGYYVCVAGKGG